MIPVLWILLDFRIQQSNHPAIEEILNFRGPARFGFGSRIKNLLHEFDQQNPTLLEVYHSIILHTIQQHLRIFFTRQNKSPSLLLFGNQVKLLDITPASFPNNARLEQARQWLVQLKLLDSKVLTKEGKEHLDKVLSVLRKNEK